MALFKKATRPSLPLSLSLSLSPSLVFFFFAGREQSSTRSGLLCPAVSSNSNSRGISFPPHFLKVRQPWRRQWKKGEIHAFPWLPAPPRRRWLTRFVAVVVVGLHFPKSPSVRPSGRGRLRDPSPPPSFHSRLRRPQMWILRGSSRHSLPSLPAFLPWALVIRII